jgi:hypothetical protein
MQIIYAYCLELEAVVTIDSARRHFICEEPPLEKYHFFCDDPHCGKQKVRITGVNYRELAADTDKFVAAHYRKLDSHHDQCAWVREDETADIERLPGETEEAAKQRRIRRKLTDLVNVFDPRLEDADKAPPTNGPRIPLYPFGPVEVWSSPTNRVRDVSDDTGEIKTSSLERLVDTYREAKSVLPPDEFKAIEIKIVRKGKMKLVDYFCHIAHASVETRDRVIFGGATLVKRYGTGFSFRFFDKVNGGWVFLYISKETMNDYRFRKYIELTLSKSKVVKYFTVYALGHLVAGKTAGNIDLKVENLRHLSISLGPSKSEH